MKLKGRKLMPGLVNTFSAKKTHAHPTTTTKKNGSKLKTINSFFEKKQVQLILSEQLFQLFYKVAISAVATAPLARGLGSFRVTVGAEVYPEPGFVSTKPMTTP